MLNFLLGKSNLRSAVEALWKRDKQVFEVMDILIATRKKDHKMFFDNKGNFCTVHELFKDVDGIMQFLEDTGLSEVFKNKQIKNLEDYVFGVETGLDTNARKNRSGIITEKIISNIFSNAGVSYRTQVSSSEFPKISNILGDDKKIFDFTIQKKQKTFLIEVNFYSSGGSKLNEVARAYQELGQKINKIENFEFVWITDGLGWKSAKNKLQEAYNNIPKIYNLTNIQDFIELIKK